MARKKRPTSAQATPVNLDRPFGGSAIMPPRMVAEAIGGVGTEAPTTELGRRMAASAAVTKAHGPMPEGPGFPQAAPQTGDRMKLDHGKAPWHLAPWDAFLAIVHVLAFGAAKYRARGWEEGMAWDRLFSAAQRHLTDWFMRVDKGRGPGRDADTGYSDLWHAACCVCFLISYELRDMTHSTTLVEGNVQVLDTRPVVPSHMAAFLPPKE